MTRPFLAAAALLLVAGGAAAQPAPAAEIHSRAGKELFEKGRYADAVAEYEAAYRLTHSAKYLYNIARSYHLQGDKAKALEHYRRYLVEDPKGIAAAEAREYADALAKEAADAPASPDRKSVV